VVNVGSGLDDRPFILQHEYKLRQKRRRVRSMAVFESGENVSLFGMDQKELMKLAKKFVDARDFLGLSKEEVAKMLNVSVGEITYLETWAMINLKEKPKVEKM
jgi:DNA-directed RNA polymerase specialized sigma24 family protein